MSRKPSCAMSATKPFPTGKAEAPHTGHGKRRPLHMIFNLGPFPVGGNLLTVNKRKYPLDSPYNANHGVSMRLIVDFSDMNASLHVLPTGESGQLKSPNYRDQISLYLNGRYHPVWIGTGEAENHGQGILTLRPM